MRKVFRNWKSKFDLDCYCKGVIWTKNDRKLPNTLSSLYVNYPRKYICNLFIIMNARDINPNLSSAKPGRVGIDPNIRQRSRLSNCEIPEFRRTLNFNI